jgi:hypothetical protein
MRIQGFEDHKIKMTSKMLSFLKIKKRNIVVQDKGSLQPSKKIKHFKPRNLSTSVIFVAHLALLDPIQQTKINANPYESRTLDASKREKTKQKFIVGGILNSQTMRGWDLTELVSSI